MPRLGFELTTSGIAIRHLNYHSVASYYLLEDKSESDLCGLPSVESLTITFIFVDLAAFDWSNTFAFICLLFDIGYRSTSVKSKSLRQIALLIDWL